MEIIRNIIYTKNTGLSKLSIEVQKPLAILNKVKSEYQLQVHKDSLFLKSKLKMLQNAISIIEEQKSVLSDDSSVSILLSNNKELFEYSKQLALELYESTNST